MSGRRQLQTFITANRDGQKLPKNRFENMPHSNKVRCTEYGKTGYGPTHVHTITGFDGRKWPWHHQYKTWQIMCLQDHNWPCSCGLKFIRYVDLWRHIGATRPTGWGRQGSHQFALATPLPQAERSTQ